LVAIAFVDSLFPFGGTHPLESVPKGTGQKKYYTSAAAVPLDALEMRVGVVLYNS